jgi:DNA-binding winged helix-turn-helix (wHTH) protein
MRIAFGDCVLDGDTRELFRAGKPVPLSPKAWELLDLLLRRRPKALSKEEIHERLWPKTFVSDASLTNLVAEIRAALGDSAREPRMLRTVQRFGYAFIGEAAPERERPPRSQAFRLDWEGREVPLPAGESILGREEEVAVWIDDDSVSRRHARIRVSADGATLEDLDSKNGTFRNGSRVVGRVALSDRDEIRIGRAKLVFRVLSRTQTTRTARSGKLPAAPPRPAPRRR